MPLSLERRKIFFERDSPPYIKKPPARIAGGFG
jgi:hypothetical protein